MQTSLIDALHAMPLFEALNDQQLTWLADHVEQVPFEGNQRLFSQGDLADAFWVLLEGEWEILSRVGDVDTPFVISSVPGTWAGSTELDDRYPVTAYVTRPSTLLRISHDDFHTMMTTGFPIARHLLDGIRSGTQRMSMIVSQREQLTALGKLSAGLAHELNNPAAAARRAASQLRQVMRDRAEAALRLAPPEVVQRWRPRLLQLRDEIGAAVVAAQPLDTLRRSDQEDGLIAWLTARNVEEPWDAAATLVDAGISSDWLEDATVDIPADHFPALLDWIVAVACGDMLLQSLDQSTARISELIGAIRSYTYMDRAPIQEIDVHDGLENTLTILHHRLKGGVEVERDYDRSLPRITAYAGELNQVWTNLIDNAIQAMNGHGRLTIRTAREGPCVLVEIIDGGPGIPPDVQQRIFEPFFTTKQVGEGTGLGLDIARRVVVDRHRGDIRMKSRPGETSFSVRLPLEHTEG